MYADTNLFSRYHVKFVMLRFKFFCIHFRNDFTKKGAKGEIEVRRAAPGSAELRPYSREMLAAIEKSEVSAKA